MAVLDIHAVVDAGRLDRHLLAKAWQRIGVADVVWASDRFKAEAAARLGRLPRPPLVCHNVPDTNYLPEPTWPRDGWLRAELRKRGAILGETGGCIVARIGAIGPAGGIEETLAAMPQLPEETVFVMMGRPDPNYRDALIARLASSGLQRRAFFWDRPSDEVWKRTLLGADVGHMIHGPFPPGRHRRVYELNSSLSNNRLFQYMAAGLPILSYDDPRMNDIHTEVDCFRVCRLTDLTADLTTHVREVGADPAARERCGRAGRAAHLAKYNWKAEFAPVVERICHLTTHT